MLDLFLMTGRRIRLGGTVVLTDPVAYVSDHYLNGSAVGTWRRCSILDVRIS